MYKKYFDELEKACAIRNRKEGTLITYKHYIKIFLDWSGKNPEDVTLEDARDFIYELRVDKKMSTQYCNGINAALKFFYRHVLHKPWDQDVVPRMTNDLKLPDVMPLESIEKMIDATTEVRNKDILTFSAINKKYGFII